MLPTWKSDAWMGPLIAIGADVSSVPAKPATRRWFQSAIFSRRLIPFAWQALDKKEFTHERVAFIGLFDMQRRRSRESCLLLAMQRSNVIEILLRLFSKLDRCRANKRKLSHSLLFAYRRVFFSGWLLDSRERSPLVESRVASERKGRRGINDEIITDCNVPIVRHWSGRTHVPRRELSRLGWLISAPWKVCIRFIYPQETNQHRQEFALRNRISANQECKLLITSTGNE